MPVNRVRLMAYVALTAIGLTACGTSATAVGSATTMRSEFSCSSEPLVNQLQQQLQNIPGTAIVEGTLTSTGKAEVIELQDGGRAVGTLYQLRTDKVLAGSISNPVDVWVIGGSTETFVAQVDSLVYSSQSGSGIYVITPEGLPNRLTAIYGYPVADNAVTVGFGCSNSKGFNSLTPTTEAVFSPDWSTNGLALAKTAAPVGAFEVPLSEFLLMVQAAASK